MKFFVIFFLIFLWSCQPIEKIEPVVFDNSQLSNISITASEIEVINRYESKFSDDYIDHSLKIPPINRIQAWFSENVNTKYLSFARLGQFFLSNNINKFINPIKIPFTFRMYPTLHDY